MSRLGRVSSDKQRLDAEPEVSLETDETPEAAEAYESFVGGSAILLAGALALPPSAIENVLGVKKRLDNDIVNYQEKLDDGSALETKKSSTIADCLSALRPLRRGRKS